MELIRDRDGDLVGAWQVGRYASAPADRRSRTDWTVITDNFPSFEEAEMFALQIPADFEPVITQMSVDGAALATFSRCFDITTAGFEELREWLEEKTIWPEQLTDGMVWAWAEDVLESLYAGNGAHVEIAARDSSDKICNTTTLSDSAWIEHFDKN